MLEVPLGSILNKQSPRCVGPDLTGRCRLPSQLANATNIIAITVLSYFIVVPKSQVAMIGQIRLIIWGQTRRIDPIGSIVLDITIWMEGLRLLGVTIPNIPLNEPPRPRLIVPCPQEQEFGISLPPLLCEAPV